MLKVLIVSCCMVCMGGAIVCADEVTDAVQQGLAAYEKGNFPEAANNLDFASQLIRQKRGGDLQQVLPEALPGWTAREATNAAMGAALMGGMVSVEREYTKDDASVTISVVGDSPMLQGIMMMFSNPMMASMSGGKFSTIAGQKAMVQYAADDRSGEIQIVVGNKFLVSVKGSAVTEEELTAYAQAIKYEKCAAL